MSLVGFAMIRGATTDSLKEAIMKSLDLINFGFDTKINNVVVKPNLCYYWDYSTGHTTDPQIVGALIKLIREKISSNTDISIVESDASAMKCTHAFRMLGYEKLSQHYGVKLVNLSKDKSHFVKFTAGGQSFNLMVPESIRNADLRINVPKIKYAADQIKMTCALKNIFGCNPYPKKFRYHPKLEEAIVAINKAMRFDLCVVDGNIVSGFQPRRLGLVMASRDPVAIDVAAAKIAGVNPRTMRYLRLAHDEGLGNLSFIRRGVPLEYFAARYPRITVRKKLVGEIHTLVTRMGLGKRLGFE
jgi:uncharacterized protein (DUF362 family)